MYSRSYPEKLPTSDYRRMKSDTPLPENYSGTVMRCDTPPCENEKKTEECGICPKPEVQKEQKSQSAAKGILGDNEDLLLLAMLFLFSDRGGDKDESDILPLLALLLIL